jgi:hypothetical protein
MMLAAMMKMLVEAMMMVSIGPIDGGSDDSSDDKLDDGDFIFELQIQPIRYEEQLHEQ